LIESPSFENGRTFARSVVGTSGILFRAGHMKETHIHFECFTETIDRFERWIFGGLFEAFNPWPIRADFLA
jgi:hypothetical protein